MFLLWALLSALLQVFAMVGLPILLLLAFCAVRDAHSAIQGRIRRH